MDFIKKHWVQIVVALMLFIALSTSLPYSYYQILRWAVVLSSGFLAYNAFNENKQVWSWIFVASLILFNPIASIHFERETWEILNIIFGFVYLISIRKISIKW